MNTMKRSAVTGLLLFLSLLAAPAAEATIFFDEGFEQANQDANDVPDDVIDLLRDHKIVETELVAAVPWVVQLDPPRYTVLMNIAYNLGVPGLLGFAKMLGHVALKEWPQAVAEMRDSRWHAQVGDRALRLERIMLGGTW